MRLRLASAVRPRCCVSIIRAFSWAVDRAPVRVGAALPRRLSRVSCVLSARVRLSALFHSERATCHSSVTPLITLESRESLDSVDA